MNQFEMIAIIVIVVMIASVVKARFRVHRDGRRATVNVQEQAENLRLREEVKELKERLHVLERITVEKEDSLSREIEQLRDR
ncbi:hypothetical protein [Sphingomonas mesophila]|uniref:hypothetical protein n=1 Tax=Sphingomonas mesophila TaxID=2303576 RepID=UPI000E59402A|nr:hypothetical protein [Sphingomonas mesophila]